MSQTSTLFPSDAAEITVREQEGSRGRGGGAVGSAAAPRSSGAAVAVGGFCTSLPTSEDTPTLPPKAIKRAARLVQRGSQLTIFVLNPC